uniref:Histidine-rich membrane protein KE4 2 n=1 Tax=Aceria tosichella TaxID=561515 RepID=A0A6G1S6J3_9ACAR
MLADYSTYTYALASVTFISLAPVVVLLLLPIDNKVNLKKLLALAAGCLLGDAFLHLIPESSHSGGSHSHHDHHHDHHHHDHHHSHEHHHHEHEKQSHGHNHDHSVGIKVLAGIMMFFILEKYIYSIKSEPSSKSEKAKKKKNDDHHHHQGEDHGHIHASGILNLIADFLHNFTDGLAIGASFLSGTKLGLSTTFAIFLHEIPHEIGDYAILRQSGFSKTKAIWLQCVTAIGAVSGTVISLLIGSHDERANAWILPFTAGGFIYIATVHLIPQLKNSTFKQTVVELVCFVIGVSIMYMMSWLE